MTRRQALRGLALGLLSPPLIASMHIAGDVAAGECIQPAKPEPPPQPDGFFWDDGSQCIFVPTEGRGMP